MSTAHDLPVECAEPSASPALRLVPREALDFDEAVRRVRPRLYRYAVRRLGDLHEAEELVQEALLRAYSHREQLLTEDDLAAWSTVVTGRLVIDRLRVRGRSTSYAEVPETGRMGRDTADVVVARDEARVALDALDAMPTRQAALLWAREVEGQGYEELCARFSMTEPAVRSVLTRARKALRKEYTARGGTVPVAGLAILAPWIAGATWADKLRQVANRSATPAALSMAGVSMLGGLLLNPFAQAPQHGVPFRPSQAVVASVEEPAVPHTPTFTVAAVAVRVTSPTAVRRTPTLARTITQALPCVNGEDEQSDSNPIEQAVSRTGVFAGSRGDCVAPQGSTLYVNQPLPDNPSGTRYVTVTSELDCANVPENDLIKCETPTPQQGALQ